MLRCVADFDLIPNEKIEERIQRFQNVDTRTSSTKHYSEALLAVCDQVFQDAFMKQKGTAKKPDWRIEPEFLEPDIDEREKTWAIYLDTLEDALREVTADVMTLPNGFIEKILFMLRWDPALNAPASFLLTPSVVRAFQQVLEAVPHALTEVSDIITTDPDLRCWRKSQ